MDDSASRLRLRPGRRGQAALEAMIMMAFMLLLMFGLMHLTMFTVTRYMVNYAAFAAARAAEVGNDPEDAAEAVLENINWWAGENGTMPVEVRQENRDGWSGFTVETRVPFGLPIYEMVEPQGMLISGFAPVSIQNDAPSGGDNDQ
jgi:Flp pilus assembly protein TadG